MGSVPTEQTSEDGIWHGGRSATYRNVNNVLSRSLYHLIDIFGLVNLEKEVWGDGEGGVEWRWELWNGKGENRAQFQGKLHTTWNYMGQKNEGEVRERKENVGIYILLA